MSQLPIKRVVIYKNGVAYFEREGTVEDDASLQLSFKPSEMNDILRSMRASDLNGGKIANISYEGSSDATTTRDFSALAGGANTGSSYRLLIGSNVKIYIEDATVVGRVLAVYHTRDEKPVELVELFVENSNIISIEARKIKSLQITDAHVNSNLSGYLDAFLNSKKKDTKQVNIKCEGKGKRTIQVSYILENPIWKSNYRIHLKGGKEQEFFLEGWACVDNTSEDDWESVKLSLVSGSPISFQYEVFNPIIGVRASQFSDEGKTAQQVHQLQNRRAPQNIGGNFPAPQQHIQMQYQQVAYAPTPASAYNNAYYNNYNSVTDGFAALDVDSQTVEIGNLFHYEVQTPITVKSHNSSLVPIVSGTLKGRKLCWFNPARHSVNPLASVLVKNTLGTILDKGPIIVTEAENYLGESLLENTLLQDEEKLVPYSINLECKVSFKTTKENTPKSVSIKGGLLEITITKKTTTAYQLINNSEHEIELALDHSEAITEKIEGAHSQVRLRENVTRFFIKLPPLKKTTFNVPVVSEFLSTPKTTLLSLSKYDFAQFFLQHNLSSEGYQLLVALSDQAATVADLRKQLVEEQTVEEQIISDQRRVQSMLQSVRAETNAAFEQQLVFLENQLSQSRSRYSSLYTEWKRSKNDVHTRITTLAHDANLSAEAGHQHVEEVNATVGSFSKVLLEELLGELNKVKLPRPNKGNERVASSAASYGSIYGSLPPAASASVGIRNSMQSSYDSSFPPVQPPMPIQPLTHVPSAPLPTTPFGVSPPRQLSSSVDDFNFRQI